MTQTVILLFNLLTTSFVIVKEDPEWKMLMAPLLHHGEVMLEYREGKKRAYEDAMRSRTKDKKKLEKVKREAQAKQRELACIQTREI